MATKLPDDLTLHPLGGSPLALPDWLTTFHLASVVLDPYTNESSWVLPAARRILEHFRGSHARINFVVTAGEDDARAFLGPLVDEFLVFCDPDRAFVQAIGATTLPAFAFVRVDGEAVAVAEGWSPSSWAAVAETIAATSNWNTPDIPVAGDPRPFAGSPAGG